MLRMTEDLIWLEFELLKDFPNVKHAVFLRHGGNSQGSFHSLNLSLTVGDDQNHVQLNRRKIASQFGLQQLSWCQANHSDIVAKHTLETRDIALPCDGITTNIPKLGLAVTHADCQAAIFYDPVHHAIANVHSGWRGNVKNIYKNTIQYMNSEYGTNPENLFVCISPSLGPENAQFVNYRTELPEAFWDFQIKSTYFDLWEISRHQLQRCGILPHHIQVANIDTYANREDYFSYRREKCTGRHATAVMLL